MKAFVITEFDVPAELADAPEPHPGPGEVRVRVFSSSVNPADWMTAIGGFRAMSEYRLPAVVGRDVAGVVDEVGSDTTHVAVGEEVFGFVKRDYVGNGTFAEYVVVPEDQFVIVKPPALSWEEAGCIGLAGVTALQCLDAVGCEAGQRLLVNGATGGVGSFLIQLATRRGIKVIATARPGAESHHVRGLGAVDTVDWSAGETAAEVLGLVPDGVDGIVDLVARSTEQLTQLGDTTLRAGGVSVSTLSAAPPPSALETGGPTYANVHSSGDPELLRRLVAEIEAGLEVPIVARFPLERIDDAFAALAQAPLGKIALSIAPAESDRRAL